jgi:ABC-type dipeptide/oligopeptide/nickel transport system permease subunit
MISITTIGITILLLLAYIVLVVGVAIGAFLGLLVDYVQKLLVKEHFMLKV